MQPQYPFHPDQPVTHCPICNQEMENIFLDLEGQPVYVNAEEETITPIYFTDLACFALTDIDGAPDIVQHCEILHQHDQ